MRKALVIGIDYYSNIAPLFGCVNDATAVASVLERNEDGSVNFAVKTALSDDQRTQITRVALRESAASLFSGESDIALFYFAGHGHIDVTGGLLLAGDATGGGDGVSLTDILAFANDSKAKNKIIILDSCYSGIAGNRPGGPPIAEIREGTTILTASTAEQYADEKHGHGVFTSLLVDALDGAASNLVGEITPGSVYAHIDQSLGPWDQRPVFKTNVKSFVSLRKVTPPITLSELRLIAKLFPTPQFEYALDPSYEPERSPSQVGIPAPNPANTAKFAVLQKYNRVNLVVPVGAPHMWHAAMESKACKLTTLGEHYRRLVSGDKI